MVKNDKKKNSSFANRSKARSIALQILYQEELNPGSDSEFSETYIDEQLPKNEPLRVFCRRLVSGTRLHAKDLDEKILGVAKNWSLDRMAATDRNILRLAVYEMQHLDTPRVVVINEAVELAKTFGSNDSASFVNGILDKIR